ncbi:MAG: right-handed parallel beta-helix repeat-containing protein [Candidatus Verstraetearchaeota archaeon]|nr:right-handed parallel beta-helix repeat-containing protein [Candidatus Verstraetearchaeota archaeon]
MIDKEVYILGASGKPTIQFDGGSDNVVIKADNVLLEHLSFIKTADSLWNSYILEVPKGGHPDYLSLYGGLTIRDCSFEGGKDGAMYINMNGDFTLENSEFIGYAAYSTVQIAAFDGEVTISGNTFTGSGGGRVIVVEPGPVEQILYGGTMNIIENTVTGVKSFLVFNHWAEPSKKVDINIEENVLDDITGDAISIWTCGNIDIGKLGPVQINRNTFKNIAGAAIRVDTTEAASYGIPTNPFGVLNLTAKQNNIYGKYGIINEYTSTIDARYNYWGDPSGPFHATANPGGLGAAVSDNVTFYPWLFDSYPPPPPTWPPEPYVPPVSQTEVRGNADTILSTLGDVIIAGEDASVAGEELDYNHDGMVNIADAWDQLVDAGLLRPPSFTFDPEAASAFLRMLQSIYGETLENFPSLEGRVWLLYMLAYLPYQ